jgi:hypothetical protein
VVRRSFHEEEIERKVHPGWVGSFEQNARYVPRFIEGVTYYDLTAKPREGFGFDDLVRRLRTEFPYHLTPTSPPHGDRRAVCESATRNRRTRSMACRWTGARCYAAVSTNILHRRQCSNRVDTSLISCKIARCVAVSPSYAPAHSGFRERVLAIRGGVKRPTIAASEVNAVLRPLPVRPTRVRWSGAASRGHQCARAEVRTAVTSRVSCGRVERRTRVA